MRTPVIPKKKFNSQSYNWFINPMQQFFPETPVLKSKGNRPLKMSFEDQLHTLIYFHLQEHESARELIQHLKEDDFARECIAPENGISRSSFSEIINHRGLEQLEYIFSELCKQAQDVLPSKYSNLGELVSIDGSLIDAVLSMYWADYRKGAKKAKGHFGFDINHQIPKKIFLTEGKGAERPFVTSILSKGQTGIMDRGYQSHKTFDLLQENDIHFVCRIKNNTIKTIVEQYYVDSDSYIFYDAIVHLGTPGINQTQKPVRVVGYKVGKVKYFVATDRFDLTAEQVAEVYKLRWDIETFFKWWKKHLKVYHLIARSKYGLMVQILSGLITYLLMAIYCSNEFNESVSVKRIRQLRISIQNDLRHSENISWLDNLFVKEQFLYAKT